MPLKNSYSLVCYGCMGVGGLCAEGGRSETANKLIK